MCPILLNQFHCLIANLYIMYIFCFYLIFNDYLIFYLQNVDFYYLILFT